VQNVHEILVNFGSLPFILNFYQRGRLKP